MHVRFLVLTLILSLLIPQFSAAQIKPVSPSDLRRAIVTAVETRQKNLAEVRAFFSTEPVQGMLKSAKVDYQRVERAVATLSADEIARLAARTQQIQHDFAAGALSNQDLTYIVIALAAAVVVLVVVAAD